MAPHGGALVLELGRQAQGITDSVHYFFFLGHIHREIRGCEHVCTL